MSQRIIHAVIAEFRTARRTALLWAPAPTHSWACLAGCLFVVLGTVASAQVLYDGALGTLPGAQGWSYAALPAQSVQVSHTGSATRLVTTTANLANAGYALWTPAPLVRETGFNLAVRVRLNTETHSRADRAGFSVIVLASDRRGIELGFWTDSVFAQSDDPLFVHAEDAAFDFRAGFTDLVLSIHETNYVLFASGAPLLTGPVRDYTSFSGFPDVYETANFVFLGDNTTSAGADVEIASVALITPPLLRVTGPGVLEWTGVAGQTYTVEGSRDLDLWEVVGRVTSATDGFRYAIEGAGSPPFARVTHP